MFQGLTLLTSFAIVIAMAVVLPRLMERVVVHDQVQLVVRAVVHPRERVGVVGARLVENGERLAMARSEGMRCDRAERRDDERGREEGYPRESHSVSFVFSPLNTDGGKSTDAPET